MRARVYDKSSGTYYISEVYGQINSGYTQYIVDKNTVERTDICLVDYLDLSTKPPYLTNIERIDCNIVDNDKPFTYKKDNEVIELNRSLQAYNIEPVHYFFGYEFIWKKQKKLLELIVNGSIPRENIITEKINTKLPNWNYIEAEQDIENLMKESCGFHDSVIREIHYISGDYYDPNEHCTRFTQSYNKKFQLIFDSELFGCIEIIFEATALMQLVPPQENYLGDIFGASIFIRDYMIYFYDNKFEKIPEDYDGTFVKALGMRWRRIG